MLTKSSMRIEKKNNNNNKKNQNYIRKPLTKENQNIIFLVCILNLLNGGFSVGIPSMPCEAFNVWFGVLDHNQWEVLVL